MRESLLAAIRARLGADDVIFPRGRLIEIWDKRQVVPAMVLDGAATGSRVRYLSPRGRTENCAAGRVAHDTGVDFDPALPAEEVARKLKAWESDASARAEALDLALLWEVVLEGDSDLLELEELAILALDSRGGAERSALIRALLNDSIHFEKVGTGWRARTRESVEQARQRTEAEARLNDRRDRFRDAVAGAKAGQGPDPSFFDEFADVLEAMEGIVLGGPPHPQAGLAQSLLPAGGRSSASDLRQAAFDTLVMLGVFGHDEDLGRRRIRIPDRFPEAIETVAAEAANRGPEEIPRDDLTDLEFWAIDDPSTQEVDDALCLTGPAEPDGSREVAIAVADPASFIAIDDAVDREAFHRAVAHFLPTGTLPMLPDRLAREAASLNDGERRPAMVFFCTLDKGGALVAFRVRLAWIQNIRRISYRKATSEIEAGRDPFAALFHLAWTRVRLRHRAGAVIMRQPEPDLSVRDGEIHFGLSDPGAPSRVLVSEMMVLAGEAAADWLQEEGVPAIYRRQPPPDNLPAAAGEPAMLDAPYDPVLLRAIRRRMRPSEVSAEPGPHAGLGLPAYVQVTSPLRRYQDLVVHRQIRAHLLGSALPYDQARIQEIAATTESAERELRAAERESQNFWTLRHLESRLGEEVEAIVLEQSRRRTLAEIVPYLWTVSVDPKPHHCPGEPIELRITGVDPREGRLRCEEMV